MPDFDPDRIRKLARQLRVEPGSRVRLPHDRDPHDDAGIREADAGPLLRDGTALLSEYQARLAAQDRVALLVIIQAMDAAGKDGTIAHVMSGVNPQGVEVTSFKVPSPEEIDHDFLWRASKALPARGMIGIFNRSYYEETLVVRVHKGILDGERLPPRRRRARSGRGASSTSTTGRYLADQGTRIVKLFLNVSKAEQKRRFLARIDEPDKNWKFWRQRRPGARVLGRLPGRVRATCCRDEHQGRPLVRDPRRPQVVHAPRGVGGDPRRADRPRPAVPRADPRDEGRPPHGPGGAHGREGLTASQPSATSRRASTQAVDPGRSTTRAQSPARSATTTWSPPGTVADGAAAGSGGGRRAGRLGLLARRRPDRERDAGAGGNRTGCRRRRRRRRPGPGVGRDLPAGPEPGSPP